MYYIVQHPYSVFFIFIVPLLGWAIWKIVPKRLIITVLIACSILVLPVFLGYTYVVSNLFEFFTYALLSCLYALLTKSSSKLSVTLVFSGFLFVLLGLITFVSTIGGTISVDNEWTYKKYRIQYIRDQGFAGGALMTYKLSKYALIPIFVKEIESKINKDTTNSCVVVFPTEKLYFNKCLVEASYIKK